MSRGQDDRGLGVAQERKSTVVISLADDEVVEDGDPTAAASGADSGAQSQPLARTRNRAQLREHLQRNLNPEITWRSVLNLSLIHI